MKLGISILVGGLPLFLIFFLVYFKSRRSKFEESWNLNEAFDKAAKESEKFRC